jgi:hypothetical protein
VTSALSTAPSRPGQPWQQALEFRADLEATVIARGAVRRGRHLRIACPAPGHVDTHPSADVDLERGWVCRACGAGGGLRSLAELLGVIPARVPLATPRRVPIPPPGVVWEEWVPAWLEVRERAQAQERRLAPYRLAGLVADWCLRPRLQTVQDAFALVAELGNTEEAWEFAAQANRVQTVARMIEAELDEECRRVR